MSRVINSLCMLNKHYVATKIEFIDSGVLTFTRFVN